MISKYNVKYVTYQRKSSPVIIKLYKLRKKITIIVQFHTFFIIIITHKPSTNINTVKKKTAYVIYIYIYVV